MRTLVALTVVGVLAGAALTGCGDRAATPAAPVTPAAPDADRAASAMLALAPRLPRAAAATAFPEQAFRGPGQQPACRPLAVSTAFWTSTMTGPGAVEYLQTHAGPHFELEGTGSSSDRSGVTSWLVALQPIPSRPTSTSHVGPDDTLVYVIARHGRGIGIRVDAEVVPGHAQCANNARR